MIIIILCCCYSCCCPDSSCCCCYLSCNHYIHTYTLYNTSPLLRIAEAWLRAELEEKLQAGERREEASGPAAQAFQDPLQLGYVSGGGFSAGRMAAYNFIG